MVPGILVVACTGIMAFWTQWQIGTIKKIHPEVFSLAEYVSIRGARQAVRGATRHARSAALMLPRPESPVSHFQLLVKAVSNDAVSVL